MIVCVHVAWNIAWTFLYSAVPAARVTIWHDVLTGMMSQWFGMSSSVDKNYFWKLDNYYKTTLEFITILFHLFDESTSSMIPNQYYATSVETNSMYV